MSLRSAARLSRSLGATPLVRRASALARRAASSGGSKEKLDEEAVQFYKSLHSGDHKAPGSDFTWLLGSAVVFLPLGAWITFRGGDDEHTHHSHAGHIGDQNTAAGPVDQHGVAGPESGHVKEGDSTGRDDDEAASAQSDEAKASPHAPAHNEGSPKKELKDNTEEVKRQSAQGTRPNPPSEAAQAGNTTGGSGEDKERDSKEEKDKKSADKGVKSDDKEENSDGSEESNGDEPSAQDIKDSLTRAEKTNVPRVAMDEEAKGHQTQAETDE